MLEGYKREWKKTRRRNELFRVKCLIAFKADKETERTLFIILKIQVEDKTKRTMAKFKNIDESSDSIKPPLCNKCYEYKG